MLRGFRKPYKKLFDGEVFTTVRVHEYDLDNGIEFGRVDVIALYPRSKRYLRLGRAQIIGMEFFEDIEGFEGYSSEEFAQYDAGETKWNLVLSLKEQAKRRHIKEPTITVYTYLWTDKEKGYYEGRDAIMETIRLVTVSETLDEINIARAGELYQLAKEKRWEFIWRIGNWRLIFNSDDGVKA